MATFRRFFDFVPFLGGLELSLQTGRDWLTSPTPPESIQLSDIFWFLPRGLCSNALRRFMLVKSAHVHNRTLLAQLCAAAETFQLNTSQLTVVFLSCMFPLCVWAVACSKERYNVSTI